MSDEYNALIQAYTDTLNEIAYPTSWQRFLQTAAYNYKFDFHDQILIYTQNPEASVVMSEESWEKKYGRSVDHSKQIGLIDTLENKVKWVYDIKDTSQNDKSTKNIPIFTFGNTSKHLTESIKALNDTYGVNESTLENAVFSAIDKVTEEQLEPIFAEIAESVKTSPAAHFSKPLLRQKVSQLISNSAAYLCLLRCSQKTEKINFPNFSFRDVSTLGTQAVIFIGTTASRVTFDVMRTIIRTNMRVDKEMYKNSNRTFAKENQPDYNENTKEQTNSERTVTDNERTRLFRQRKASLHQTVQTDILHGDRNAGQPQETPAGHTGGSTPAVGRTGEAEQRSLGADRTTQKRRSNEVGRSDDKPAGNNENASDGGNNLHLDYYDREHEDKSLPFFGKDDTIREILGTTPHLKASKAEIRAFFESTTDQNARVEYIKNIFNNDYTELILKDGRRVGYKTYQNVLQFWEGSYLSRTAQSFYDWGVVAKHFEAMRLLGELQNTTKSVPAQNGQLNFIFDNEAEVEKTSAFTFSQEIIDAVLTRGSSVSEGKFRIYEQFEKSLSAKENVEFLKDEYGWGGSYPVIIGTGIDENHDVKGIHISKGIGNDKPHIDLSWKQVEKRIAELIRLERYLNPKEKEVYSSWLQKQEELRAERAEQQKNREILSTAPPQAQKNIINFANEKVHTEPEEETIVIDPDELQEKYEYHNGDTVYIGADEYEILSFDDNRVMLSDTQFPLFNKEMPRTEFDHKVQENPSNEHLKKSEPATEKIVEEENDINSDKSGLPTITCEWSESPVFEDGKTYSVSEFDSLMKQADEERVAGQASAIEAYGSEENWYNSDVQDEYTQYLGYDKVKFTLNMSDGTAYTERQDIGDGDGGVIDFLKQYPKYNKIVPILENAVAVTENTPVAEYEDAFFINRDNESVTWIYYNPDSVAGGQYVTNLISYEDIKEASEKADTPETFFDYLGSIARQELADVGSDWFVDADIQFRKQPDLTDCIPETMQKLIAVAVPERDNTKKVPVYDRELEILYDVLSALKINDVELDFDNDGLVATDSMDNEWHGNEFYEFLVGEAFVFENDGSVLGINSEVLGDFKELCEHFSVVFQDNRQNVTTAIESGYDKESDPIVPTWEKPKQPKVKSYDLHPDIPVSQRYTFDLKANEIETVGKKERFRRNIAAINVLKECEFENRFATPEEQIVLSKYVGWGGIPEAFDENNPAWADEFFELYTVLSPDEYASARESTLTAFYTPPVVISAIYQVMEQMGFKEGNILEPSCGIGHFIGMLPESMKESKIYGVELDKISAGIAQQLYQKSSIAAQGFEETNLPDSFFDGVIGNVPFGDFKVPDKRYDKHKFLIHDYFFAKSLDKLRPGGVMAFVTSKGTMDKESPAVRKYIAQRAELLGAIRLPNDTFKGNAGTEVVSDILILQKRDRLIDIEPDWIYLDTDENGIKMNSYFIQHPEMILGEMKMVSGRFGPEATCMPYENADLKELLNEAVSNIHGEITTYEIEDERSEEDRSVPADPTVRNFSYTVLDDVIYYRENSRMTPIEVSATAENRIKGMIKIRDSVRRLIDLQVEDFPDTDIKEEQQKLNNLYDAFTPKYGLINNRANLSAFSNDSSFSLLSSLEEINEDGELERKADMFYKRTIKPHIPITSVDTSSEALAVSMGEKAGVDMEYMCELSGKTEQEIFADLKGVIFLNPLYGYGNNNQSKYLTADEYLSGNVREKLTVAKRSAEIYPDNYNINVEALEKVQPKDLTASEISVRLGATWLPPKVVEEFIFEFLETPRYWRWNIKVHYSEYTGEWQVEGKSIDKSNIKAYTTYGTSRINAYKIIEETLNLKDVRIFDYIEDEDGKRKAVLNNKETAIALSKQELIKQGFQDWIWSDPTRREQLCKLYNEKFNSIRPREYDGSHIVFSGMNPEIKLREHQRNAVAHILYGGNTLLAHAVGAGKTFEMVAAAMELKRLGLCNKSLFVVPNHLTEQWGAEFLQLYPAANILVATKKDFEMKNRKKFCGRIATGEYDAVIIGHSQFEKIPMSVERQRAILEQQLEEVTNGIAELNRNRGENFSVKQMVRTQKSIKNKLDKLNDQSRKDDVVTFEELGIDRLFIDESHYYKNLFLYTKMRNVGGIAQTEAQKSSDLFMKCRYLDELTDGRGTVFATGTPISNSMVELYTIQRYLQYDTLVKNDLQHFDSWASTFGETVSAVELTPEGTGYRSKTRFAKFYNLPELMAMFKEVADIKTADTLNLPVPEAHYHNIAVKPSEIQKEMVASLAERAENVRSGGVDASVDNMLKITNDGRKLALDQRMLNPMLPDFEGSKINACVDNIYRIWEENADKKSAQLVFCDLSTPKNDGTFSVYNDIRKKLIERGIPKSEVRFIHEADTDLKKKELFQKTRKGEVRVLLGSTQKMGAGTNVQDKLIALHDVDCPWRPSDLEQRSGRIIRQGNSNPEVDIYRYVTEQTFDAYLYQLVEGKQKFASQIMTSKSPVRSAEDIDETALSYAEIKMLATGNPHIKEKMDLDIQVQKLRLLKSNFLSEKYALEDKIIKFYPQEIARKTDMIEGLKSDIERAKQHPKPLDDNFIGMTVLGVSYSEKADAGNAIIEACKQMDSPDPIPLGEYRGFQMELFYESFAKEYKINLKGTLSHYVTLGTDTYGNITRLDNALEGITKHLETTVQELDNVKNQLENAKTDAVKPFVYEDELKAKTARLNELNAILNTSKNEKNKSKTVSDPPVI